MLANAGSVDRFWPAEFADALNHVLWRKLAVFRLGESEWISLKKAVQEFPPLANVWLFALEAAGQFVGKFGDYLFGIANDRNIGESNLANFGWVNVNVNHLGIWSERFDVTGYAVVEASTKGDQ